MWRRTYRAGSDKDKEAGLQNIAAEIFLEVKPLFSTNIILIKMLDYNSYSDVSPIYWSTREYGEGEGEKEERSEQIYQPLMENQALVPPWKRKWKWRK